MGTPGGVVVPIEVIVGAAPDTAIDIAEYEETEDFVDDVVRAAAGGGTVEVNFKFSKPTRFTLQQAMEDLVQKSRDLPRATIRCFVNSEATQSKLRDVMGRETSRGIQGAVPLQRVGRRRAPR